MPYLKGKLKGQLTAPELRRMIKEHNKLMSITIPPKTDRDGLIKLINDNGYKINHEKQILTINKVMRKPNIKLPPAPTPKTAEEKKQMKIKKSKKEEQLETKGYDSRKKKIDILKDARSIALKKKDDNKFIIDKSKLDLQSRKKMKKIMDDNEKLLKDNKMFGKSAYKYFQKELLKDKLDKNSISELLVYIKKRD